MQIPGLSHAIRYLVRSVAGVVLRWTSNPSRAEHAQDVYILRMPWFFHAIGVAILLLVLYGLYDSLPFHGLSIGITVFAIAFILFIAGLGVYPILEGLNHKVVFNSSKFYVTNLFRKTTMHEWSQIQSISSGGSNGDLTIKFKDGSKVKVSQYLLGMRTFLEFLEARTGIALLHGKKKILWWT